MAQRLKNGCRCEQSVQSANFVTLLLASGERSCAVAFAVDADSAIELVDLLRLPRGATRDVGIHMPANVQRALMSPVLHRQSTSSSRTGQALQSHGSMTSRNR
eukprot:TRINITY_DN12304_c0_g1_i10.p3 TRINITY_DN12304_c0_g1~~TRINITY_DN12304_c0_g1_i10.p3  ORF type:complete len:103 (-),score=2.94 TRINITY_DN12304_c0_g1_i10:793-1101(-)